MYGRDALTWCDRVSQSLACDDNCFVLAPAGHYLAGLIVDPACRREVGAELTRRRLAWICGEVGTAGPELNAPSGVLRGTPLEHRCGHDRMGP